MGMIIEKYEFMGQRDGLFKIAPTLYDIQGIIK